MIAHAGQSSLPQAAELNRLDEEVTFRVGLSVSIAVLALPFALRLECPAWLAALAIGALVCAALALDARRTAKSTDQMFVNLVAARQTALAGLVAAAIEINPAVVRKHNHAANPMSPFPR